jgi:anhydro-N-acetylmuramic acid kinase
MVIAGVMSGSSLDGLDIAIVEYNSDTSWDILWTYDRAYSEKWVERLKNYPELSAAKYIALKSDYSKYIGNLLVEAFALYDGEIDFVSFHGHTLMHAPENGITEQIGNGGILAALLGIPSITDFRIQDVTKGGVGTPLAPIVELSLFEGHDYYLNLGGIANITSIGLDGDTQAYDVCPCNQVLNHFSNKVGKVYDEGGSLAREGATNTSLIKYLDTVDYFQLAAPKSLDNNWIVEEFIPNIPSGKVEDILHTYCNWMATCIATEVEEREIPASLMVSGGGAHSIYFMECLKTSLAGKNCNLFIPSKKIIDFKEAILMSLMAYKYLQGEKNVLSSVTGASSDSIGGALYKV